MVCVSGTVCCVSVELCVLRTSGTVCVACQWSCVVLCTSGAVCVVCQWNCVCCVFSISGVCILCAAWLLFQGVQPALPPQS